MPPKMRIGGDYAPPKETNEAVVAADGVSEGAWGRGVCGGPRKNDGWPVAQSVVLRMHLDAILLFGYIASALSPFGGLSARRGGWR